MTGRLDINNVENGFDFLFDESDIFGSFKVHLRLVAIIESSSG